ncbi:MAG: transposase zinc-binding domain-containing protein [Pseudobdellovibrionaceae bacterium]
MRAKCTSCPHEMLVAFSCKKRGFCPSCGARRMSETAAHLVDHVLPHKSIRQWVLTFPVPIRLCLAAIIIPIF